MRTCGMIFFPRLSSFLLLLLSLGCLCLPLPGAGNCLSPLVARYQIVRVAPTDFKDLVVAAVNTRLYGVDVSRWYVNVL